MKKFNNLKIGAILSKNEQRNVVGGRFIPPSKAASTGCCEVNGQTFATDYSGCAAVQGNFQLSSAVC
jgi:hypothetical protein